MPPREAPKLIILSERGHGSSATGIARRIEHLEAAAGGRAVRRPLDVPQGLGRRARSRLTHAAIRRVAAELPAGADVHVVGLAAPHLLLAMRTVLQAPGIGHVTFDVCDSWLLQFSSRLRARRPGLAALSLVGAFATRFSPRRLRLTYISERDRRADRWLAARGRTSVVPPIPPPGLVSLPPVTGMPTRIAASMDGRAFHTQRNLALLQSVWPRIHEAHPALALDVYGRDIPASWGMPGVTVKGYAPQIEDLYRGDTLVYVSNDAGSGVPNKVVEAVAAQRPMLLPVAMKPLLEPHPWLGLFHDAGSLVAAIDRTMTAGLPQTAEPIAMRQDRGWPLPPTS